MLYPFAITGAFTGRRVSLDLKILQVQSGRPLPSDRAVGAPHGSESRTRRNPFPCRVLRPALEGLMLTIPAARGGC